jgi:Leucine-rich repeat (LRR) protein
MSSIILSSYYRDLNGVRIKLNKQIRQTKFDWKSYENREPEEMFIAKTADKIEYNDIASAMDHSEDIIDISLIRYKKVPKAIKKFKNLIKISFEDCQSIDLERTISLISSIEHLENLYFFKNGFNIYPENIGDLNGLKTLWIDGDSIKYLPNSIRKLTSLAELNITECYNLDFRFLFDQIISIDSLTELNFSENGLKDLPENIDQLINIKEIWLDDNLLIEIPNGIKKLHKLEYLRLFDNQIDSLNIESGDLPNLKNINLCYNNFQTIPMELAYLNRLERVSMWSCEISTIPSEISILSQLKYLNLRWNNLSKEQKIRLTKQLPFTELILE